MGPDEVLADTLYGSDENCEKARKEKGVRVVSPTTGATRDKGLTLADFEFSSNDGHVKSHALSTI